jgi:hypothetical protein
MKFITILILSFFLLQPSVSEAQTGENQAYTYYRPIDSDFIAKEFAKFRYRDIFEDTVLVTMLSKKNKSKDLTRDELKKWMMKNYYDKNFNFEKSAVVNDGYVIGIGQYSEIDEIPIRFFTLYLSHKSGKIVVMEIEETR